MTYTFTATNTGTTTLTNVVVTDPMVGLIIEGNPIDSLAVGASSSVITGTYTIAQSDLDAGTVTNSALATAQDPDGNDVTDISGTALSNDSSTVTSLPQTSTIALVKDAVFLGTGMLGEVIAYVFTAVNTGTTTITNVVVMDPMVGLTLTGNPIDSLEAGASSSVITGLYTITQDDIDAGTLTNSALATAQDPDGNDVTDTSGTAFDNDSSTVTSLPQTSTIALVKDAVFGGTGGVGDVITYTFTATNTGTTTLTNVVVTDPMVGLILSGNPIDSLAVGASSSVITGTYTIAQSDIDAGTLTNSALATAQDPDGNDVTDISGTALSNDSPTETSLPQTSTIALVKDAVFGGTGGIGDVITYTFTATNTGTTTMTNVVVTDPMVGLILTGSPIESLEAGASSSVITGTYTIAQSDIDAGTVINSALATAQDPDGNDVTDISGTALSNDSSTVTTLAQTSAITLVKTAIVSGMGMLGDVITYIFTLENTGNTTLTNVVVTDPMITSPVIGSPIASLASGGTTIAMATYTITSADIDAGGVTNVATATAQDPNGTDVTDTSGTQNDNDTPTDTPVMPPVVALADFTPSIDIDALVFSSGGLARDFVINISEIAGAPSVGQVVVKIAKGNAFTISYGAATTTSNVGGGASVNNNDWDITEDLGFITMTLKDGVVILEDTSSAIGFTIERNVGVPSSTAQPVTATILDGSGSDSQDYNNTYNTVVVVAQ
jgi:hypothetical protein